MNRYSLQWIAISLSSLMVGCSAVVPYTPQQQMSFDQAREIVEEMLLTQHPAWRPDFIEVTEKFIAFDEGSATKTHSWGGAPFVASNSRTRKRGGRAYYKYVTKIELVLWKRKFKTWYRVALHGDLAIRDPVVLRTRDLGKAELLVDALSSLVEMSRQDPRPDTSAATEELKQLPPK
jgi:hypothetical protein